MSYRSLTLLGAVAAVALGFTAVASAQPTPSRLWSDISPAAIAPAAGRVLIPLHYRALTLERDALTALLAQAPLEGSAASAVPVEIDLPLPDGPFGRFAVVESPIMEPRLQARYPEIRTYAGHGIDDPSATARFDLTPVGFHAQIFSAGGTIYIDPFQRGDDRHYQSYYRRDFRSDKSPAVCTVVDGDAPAADIDRLAAGDVPRSGTQLRTYRAAVAATGEYTAVFGGTVAAGLAAVVTTMNRVAAIYERDVSIRLVLVTDNDLIIFTEPTTDPYTNDSGTAMLLQNQLTLDATIGSTNYDIGHVFSTGGGGVAGFGVVCRSFLKARGVSGLADPQGDPFDIDIVAHEMGHQFNANHTFNGTTGACAGGNRVASAAYEPGSGSTIMALAGYCSPQDLQAHNDDYFHWYSIQEIVAFTTTGWGNACPVTSATGVTEPTVDAGIGGFAIPIGTPFALTAAATATGTATFCWEEADLGPAEYPDMPSGTAPIFRSFDPVTTPTRTFPKLSDLLDNTDTIGELLPSYARSLSFKVTVRDVQTGGVGVANDLISFTVAAAGPFRVTYPNTAVNWFNGSDQTVTWSVAGTSAAPISCNEVNILLSTDGGYTWPVVLAAGTPNDGSEPIHVLANPTSLARIKVEAAGNVFFDISNTNFTIYGPPAGSCCTPAGACTVTMQGDCPDAWTMFGVCAPNPCVQPPDPAHCTVSPWNPGGCFLVCPGRAWAYDAVHVTVRNALNEPISGAEVAIDISPCAGLCVDPDDGLDGVTDQEGYVLLSPQVGGCATCPVTLSANGVVLRTLNRVVSQDVDGNGVVDQADLNLWQSWQYSGYNACGDFDCSGSLDAGDLSYFGPAFEIGSENPSGCLPGAAPDSIERPARRIPELSVRTNPARSGDQVELQYYLPAAGPVRIEAFDASGRRLADIMSGNRSAGEHRANWTGVGASDGRSGVYFLRLWSTSGRANRKLVVLE